MEENIAPGTVTPPKQEIGEGETIAEGTCTASTDSGRSGIITKNAGRRSSSTKKSRAATSHIEHGHQNKAELKKGDESKAAPTDCSDRKTQANMQFPIVKKTEKVGKKHDKKDNDGNGEMYQHDVKEETSAHRLKNDEESTLCKTDESIIQNQQADKNDDLPVTSAPLESMKREDQHFTNRFFESKKACAVNEALSDEITRKFEHQENEEEKRRRIRLSRILESSGMVPNNQKTETGMRQKAQNASTLKDTVGKMLARDYMSAGDGQEDHLKTKSQQSQNQRTISRDHETEGGHHGVLINRNLEAGGDAGIVPVIQHCANKTQAFRQTVSEYAEKPQPFREFESTQTHHIIKSTEKNSKGTSIQKGELMYASHPPIIPIKPIPALNQIGAQENEGAPDNLNASPDAGLLFHPEIGTMKSKPVPKPTRGRRGRTRSPSSTPGCTGYRPFLPHPEMHFPEQALYVPAHPYQRYMLPEFGPGLPNDYCEVVPGHGSDFVAYSADAAGREVMGGGNESISSAYPGNRWYCKDFFKMPRPLYAPRAKGRGGAVGRGRPRGRRGAGGVRQYLQHRLLWARYTGRSQEALDRVLSIINEKCRIPGVGGGGGPREAEAATSPPHAAKLWEMTGGGSETLLDGPSPADALASEGTREVGLGGGLYGGRLDNNSGRRGCAVAAATDRTPAVAGPPPYGRGGGGGGAEGSPPAGPYSFNPYYNPRAGVAATISFSSNISNMMAGDSSSSGSILRESGIASNAVVDGNGYIVYLNQDDSTQYQQQTQISFMPSETSLENRGDPGVLLDREPLRSDDIKAETDVTEEMAPSQQACVGVDAASIVPNTMVVEGIPSDSNLADMGATGETSAVAAMPLEGSLASSMKKNGKQTTVRKRGTPKTAMLKTPVTPIKEHKAPKRHGQASGGRPKKRVRRTLTFSSPIKQEETLRATENIANALSSTSLEAEAEATCSVPSAAAAVDSYGQHPSSTPVPPVSNLLHSSTSADISINIHVTNDANKEQAVPNTKSKNIGAESRAMTPGTLEQTSKNTVRAQMLSRPEAPSLPHYPEPRYTIEWHGDYHQQDPGEMGGMERRYQDHHQQDPEEMGGMERRYQDHHQQDPREMGGMERRYQDHHQQDPREMGGMERRYQDHHQQDPEEMERRYQDHHQQDPGEMGGMERRYQDHHQQDPGEMGGMERRYQDHHQQDPGEMSGMDRRYQDHHLLPTTMASNTSMFRYPYKDPDNSHNYYSQLQHPFPAPATPLNHYYSTEYARDWTSGGTYARYPSQHFMTGYEGQSHHHPAVSNPYPAAQWNASGWNRPPPEMFVESYQNRPTTSARAGLDMDIRESSDLRDLPYKHYHTAAASYPRPQAEFPEEVYPQTRSAFTGYTGSVMEGPHTKERLAAVPEEFQDARQPGDFESQHLRRPWPVAANCGMGPQVMVEGSVGQLATATDSPQQLQPPVVSCTGQEQGHMEATDLPSQLSQDHASQM